VDIVRCLKNVWMVIKVDFFRYLSEMISIREREKRRVLKRKFFDENAMLKLFFNTIKHAFRYDEGIKT
jgi:hypothetical protein